MRRTERALKKPNLRKIAILAGGIGVMALAQVAGAAEQPPPMAGSATPDRAEILARIVKILAEHLDADPSKINLDTSWIDDLGADSLDSVELVMAVEEEFDIEIPDDAAEHMATVSDLVSFVADGVAPTRQTSDCRIDDQGERQGQIKWYNAEKGYGFINPDGPARDVFVTGFDLARSGVEAPPAEGDRVTFETRCGPRGQYYAVGIKVLAAR